VAGAFLVASRDRILDPKKFAQAMSISDKFVRRSMRGQTGPARTRRQIMRVMVFAIAAENEETALEPTPEALEAWAAMDRFTEELVSAGVMIAGAGLKPTAEGKRIVCEGPARTIIDGPFAESREIVAGFSIWEVRDMDEAMAWAKRAPNHMQGRSVMEIRPFYEAADLADFVTPEELANPREGERGKLGVA
jgi:hypothetical protein